MIWQSYDASKIYFIKDYYIYKMTAISICDLVMSGWRWVSK